MAVINDFKSDVKNIMQLENATQNQLAEQLGISQQGISKAMTRKQFNDLFVSILDLMGYDIKVTYVKHEQSAKETLHKGV